MWPTISLLGIRIASSNVIVSEVLHRRSSSVMMGARNANLTGNTGRFQRAGNLVVRQFVRSDRIHAVCRPPRPHECGHYEQTDAVPEPFLIAGGILCRTDGPGIMLRHPESLADGRSRHSLSTRRSSPCVHS